MALWLALALPLAYHKGTFNNQVAWIGAELAAYYDKVIATAKKHILNDLFRVMTVTEQLRAEALQTALPLCKGLRDHCARNTTDWLACSENTR